MIPNELIGLDDAGPCSSARKFHPDVNKEEGAEAKFMEISNAYEVLSDDQKKVGRGR